MKITKISQSSEIHHDDHVLDSTTWKIWFNLITKDPNNIKKIPDHLLENNKIKNSIGVALHDNGFLSADGIINFDKLSGQQAKWLGIRINDYMNSGEPSKYGTLTAKDEKTIIEYLAEEKPDLKQLNDYSLQLIRESAQEWKKLKERKEAIGNYKTNNVVYSFEDGWKIVEVSSQDIPSESFLMELNHYQNEGWKGTLEETEENHNEHFKVYSLRSPSNEPKATIPIRKITSVGINGEEIKDPTYDVEEFVGTGSYSEIDNELKPKIKEFLDTLRAQGKKLTPPYDITETVDVKDLDEFENYDEYGFRIDPYNIGGDKDTYLKNIQNIEQEAWSGSHFLGNKAETNFEKLIEYASLRNELKELSEGLQSYEETVWERFNDYMADVESSGQFEHPYPEEEDFYIHPDEMETQPEFEGKEFQGKPKFDSESYNKAYELYEEERSTYEEYFEPSQFANHAFKKMQEAIKIKEKEEKKEKENMKTAMTKEAAAEINDEDIPSPDALGAYSETLKLYLKSHPDTDPILKHLIENLPPKRNIRKTFSYEECKVLFESINYAWKKVTGKDIIKESEITKAPETLEGCYWILKHGILLHGRNHYMIIKNNFNILVPMLGLNGFTVQELMTTKPNKLIYHILDNGVIRMFADKDRNAYFQMTPEVYAEWGKKKVRKYDMKKKIVKIIDRNAPFKGWKSGVAVKLS